METKLPTILAPPLPQLHPIACSKYIKEQLYMQ